MATEPTGSAPPPAARFAPGELGEVLRHYELGELRSVRELLGGDSGSPKAMVECARGRFVLKRRAPGRDNPFRVGMCHEVMLHLRARGFAVPALIGTRGENNSLLQLDGRVYELFTFVEGEAYARTPGQARAVGCGLARLHALLRGFSPRLADPPPVGQAMAIVRRGVQAAGNPPEGTRLEALCERAEVILGSLDRGDTALLHGDFHPGNLLFRGEGLAAVFDFEGLRRGPLVVDLAQAMVQSAMVRAEGGPGAWPAETDLRLARALWEGYVEGGDRPGPDGLAPHMAVSLGVEWADGVAGGVLGAPGSGGELLGAVVRKMEWLLDHAGEVRAALG